MRIVRRLLEFLTAFADVIEKAQALSQEITALGGTAALEEWWKDENGVDRTDRELTFAEFQNAFTTVNAFTAAISAGHKTNVFKAIRNR